MCIWYLFRTFAPENPITGKANNIFKNFKPLQTKNKNTMKKIALYSLTFGERKTKYYEISLFLDIIEKADNPFESVINELVKLSGCHVFKNEKLDINYK